MQKKTLVFLAIITLVFISIRLFGIHSPLHQDEYKWPRIVDPASLTDTTIPHPPLSEFIYRAAGHIVGYGIGFRFVPLFFGVLNLLLLFYFLKYRYGERVARVGAVIFTFSYFSILASLMVDTDGAIIPFFFLCMLIAYYRAAEEGISHKKRILWITGAVVAALLGFLVKISFVLPVAALAADFLWQRRHVVNTKQLLNYAGYALGFIGLLVAILVIASKVFSFFDLSGSIAYWGHFANIHRNWLQTMIQVVKALLYTSPALVLTPFFLSKEQWGKVRPFMFYLLFGFIFYVLLFDFSIGALDRYFQFIIIPLSVMAAIVLDRYVPDVRNFYTINKKWIWSAIVFSAILFLLQYLPHGVPSLYPKTLWIGRIESLRWNFLYPFSGGSGPLGFYISFLYMALSWIVGITLCVASFIKKFRVHTPMLVVAVFILSAGYTFAFSEEYLFGRINGSAPYVLADAVSYIKNNPDIKKVIVYNDNGGDEIQRIGKYEKRLYTDPAFDLSDKIKSLNTYKETYLEVNVPRIDPTSVYRKYLDSCAIMHSITDHAISAIVYDCSKALDISR